MQLADGTFWPLPVTLPVDVSQGAQVGMPLALRDVYGNLLGLMHVKEIYEVDKKLEADCVLGTTDLNHPAVAYLDQTPSHYASGDLEIIRVPPHYDFVPLRQTPAELRAKFDSLGWSRIIAFQPPGIMNRIHEAQARQALKHLGGNLLIHPVVGVAKPGDVDHYTRVRCYKATVESAFESGSALLSLMPSVMRMAGPRETLLHAIVHRNYGCSDMIVSPDYADPLRSPSGESFYDSTESQSVLQKFKSETGMGFVSCNPMVYAPDQDDFLLAEIEPNSSNPVEPADISDKQLREDYLAKGKPLPQWLIRPEVAAILEETCPAKHKQGLTIWFTGLSGSGKSTVAHGLVERLAEFGRNVAFLDGDEIRTHLSKGLSFSKEDRDTNINRVGYVAGLIAAQGGTTICSVISPYRATREKARNASKGNFVEIFCDTPIAVCETRDVKGLYAKARAAVAAGSGLGFTGIDDAYEAPLNPEVTLDTSRLGVADCVEVIVAKLRELGYIRD